MIKRLLLLVIILVLSVILVGKLQDKNAVLINRTGTEGVVFIDGIYQQNLPFCLVPEQGKNYNIALVQDGSRQNIQIQKNDRIQISNSEGDSLGLSVKLIYTNDSICQI